MAEPPDSDIGDQSGRVAVITGANGGIGEHTAAALAGAGARVVLACRDLAKTDRACDRIRAAHPGADLEVVGLDLSSQASVRAAAATIAGTAPRLDLLICNAGVMATPRRVTEDGWELQFATNHLGHFALVGHLLDTLTGVEGSRVVTVTSFMARLGSIDFDDLQGERRYRRWPAYCQSKLANAMFSMELARRLARADAPTIAVAAHPGYARTGLQSVGPRMSGSRISEATMTAATRLVAQSAEGGARPSIFAATAPGLAGGELVGPTALFGSRGAPGVVRPFRQLADTERARRLWALSEELTGVRYLD